VTYKSNNNNKNFPISLLCVFALIQGSCPLYY